MPENRQRFSNTNKLSFDSDLARATTMLTRGIANGAANPDAHTASRGSRYGSSFEARFGRVILQNGIAAIPSAIFHYQGEIGLKAQHVWFISYILSHKWDEDLPYPSLSHMARCAGVTLRNIQFIKSELCRAGMLEVSERYNGKGGRESNAYDFSGLFAHLEELISQDADQPNRIVADTATTDSLTTDPIESDPSFVARFGRVIARRGVAAVPRAIFTHQKALALSPQQVWFISYIFSFQWSTSLPYPSINKMVQHTGYSRAHLHTIKAELVESGYLRLVHRTNEQGGQDSNAYDFSGLLDAIRAHLQPDPDPPADDQGTHSDGADPAEGEGEAQAENPIGRHLFAPRRGQGGARRRASTRTLRDPHEVGQTGVYEAEQTAPYEVEHTRGYEGEQTEGYEIGQTPLYEGEQTTPVRKGSYSPANGSGLPPMKRGGHESESVQTETNKKKHDSNQISQKSKVGTREARVQDQPETARELRKQRAGIPGYSPYIAAVTADFSRELGDTAHELPNIKQALNLWQSSGLREQAFVELMQEARSLTRKYQSRPTWDTMSNKMAYFYATLRDLVGLQKEE